MINDDEVLKTTAAEVSITPQTPANTYRNKSIESVPNLKTDAREQSDEDLDIIRDSKKDQQQIWKKVAAADLIINPLYSIEKLQPQRPQSPTNRMNRNPFKKSDWGVSFILVVATFLGLQTLYFMCVIKPAYLTDYRIALI